jgi:hypothetical protein
VESQEDLDRTLDELSNSRVFFDLYRVFFKLDYKRYVDENNFRGMLRWFIDKRV